MKKVVKVLLVFILLISISCNEDSLMVSDGDMNIVEKATSKEDPVAIVTIPGLADASGYTTATLRRNKNGVTANFKTSGLDPGAYTLWFVVFNNPGDCEGEEGCNEPDLFIEAVKGEVLFATGHVVGNNGKGNFSARLNEGDNSGSVNSLFGIPDNDGLRDSQAAEIHLVLRTHGPALPGMVNEQIGSYTGGCVENDCEDILAAVFPPN